MNTLRKCSIYGQQFHARIRIIPRCNEGFAKFCTSSVSSSSSSSKDKYVLFVRHGLTEMNEHLERMPWFSENFFDAELWDTRLSERGIQQAIDAHISIEVDQDSEYALHKMEVVLSSPLTRALHTAELLFKHQRNLLPSNIPHIAHPLLRERLYLSSEVGRSRSELQREFPHWDLSAVPEDQPWWYVHPKSRMNKYFNMNQSIETSENGTKGIIRRCSSVDASSSTMYDSTTNTSTSLSMSEEVMTSQFSDINSVHAISTESTTTVDQYDYVEWRPEGRYCCEGEPSEVFLHRINQLKEYLNNRPEQYMVVVAHWGIIRALTGQEFKNCEMKLVKTSDFLEDPLVSDE